MRILPLIFNRKSNVNIIRDIDESQIVSSAFGRLNKVESMLNLYAKKNNVDLFVSSVIPDVKNKTGMLDNILLVTVKDARSDLSKSANFVINRHNDIYPFQKTAEIFGVKADGDVLKYKTVQRGEDNFVRAFFRTVETLVKQVKNQD